MTWKAILIGVDGYDSDSYLHEKIKYLIPLLEEEGGITERNFLFLKNHRSLQYTYSKVQKMIGQYITPIIIIGIPPIYRFFSDCFEELVLEDERGNRMLYNVFSEERYKKYYKDEKKWLKNIIFDKIILIQERDITKAKTLLEYRYIFGVDKIVLIISFEKLYILNLQEASVELLAKLIAY